MFTMPHAEIRDLLAPYALDAVDAGESDIVDVHLRDCPSCAEVIRGFRENVSHLAAGDASVPGRVWDAIAERLEKPSPHRGDYPLLAAHRRRRPQLALLAAAAAIAVIAGLGAQLASQERRLGDMGNALEDRTVLSAALAAEGHPDARRAELRTPDGTIVAHAVLTPDGSGFLRTKRPVRVADDRTLQLWAVIGTERISAGVLGPAPEVVAFRVAGEVIGLAITEEVAGGVVASNNQPVATGLVIDN